MSSEDRETRRKDHPVRTEKESVMQLQAKDALDY